MLTKPKKTFDCVAMKHKAQKELHEEYEARGVTIVAISVDADSDVVGPHVQREGLTYPILLGGQAVQVNYRITGLPTLFVVDQEGVVRHVHVGYAPGAGSVLADQIEALLAEA